MSFDLFMKKQEDNRIESLPIFKEYAIDFKTGQPLYKNGEIITLEKKEALKVWIFKALKTERFKYDIHSDAYGTELRENVGYIYDKSIRDVIIIEQIKDCLLVSPYILEVYDFETIKVDDKDPEVTFKVDTIYGTILEGGADIL